jgi:uncharacterized protein YjiS (DUF1127 family)
MPNTSELRSGNVSRDTTCARDGSARLSPRHDGSRDPFLRATAGLSGADTEWFAASAGMYAGVDPFTLGFLEDYENQSQPVPHAGAGRETAQLHRARSPSIDEGPLSAEVSTTSSRKSALVTSWVRCLWSVLCRRWLMSQARRELCELDDHMLKDIGIHRCQIESVVRHGKLYRP